MHSVPPVQYAYRREGVDPIVQSFISSVFGVPLKIRHTVFILPDLFFSGNLPEIVFIKTVTDRPVAITIARFQNAKSLVEQFLGGVTADKGQVNAMSPNAVQIPGLDRSP